ncbi:ATP-NAD kinase family protein, partial [Kitasatospora sp. NPDC059803]|uniref:ATP-NAD kinase family protein n=1 Tax=Kitasatospora sp. NPDC059803 TaxID=3346953 RepID=UPI003648876E
MVNPVAGLGGRVGLKGSDGAEVQQRARALGARPAASSRAELMLRQFALLAPQLTLLTAAGPMGADAARAAGLDATVVHRPAGPGTTAADTRAAGRALVTAGGPPPRVRRGPRARPAPAPAPSPRAPPAAPPRGAGRARHPPRAGLLLVCGGDGTARDVLDALDALGPLGTLGPEPGPPVLGIPAGVKMHSAVFAVHPRAAAEVAAAWAGGGVRLASAEVVDRDEAALREGRVSARLHGWLTVPVLPARVQQRKTGSSTADPEALGGIAAEVAERGGGGGRLARGPGGTTHA